MDGFAFFILFISFLKKRKNFLQEQYRHSVFFFSFFISNPYLFGSAFTDCIYLHCSNPIWTFSSALSMSVSKTVFLCTKHSLQQYFYGLSHLPVAARCQVLKYDGVFSSTRKIAECVASFELNG